MTNELNIGNYVKIDYSYLPFDIIEKHIYKIVDLDTPFGVLLLNIDDGTNSVIQKRFLYKDAETKAINRKEKINNLLKK